MGPMMKKWCKLGRWTQVTRVRCSVVPGGPARSSYLNSIPTQKRIQPRTLGSPKSNLVDQYCSIRSAVCAVSTMRAIREMKKKAALRTRPWAASRLHIQACARLTRKRSSSLKSWWLRIKALCLLSSRHASLELLARREEAVKPTRSMLAQTSLKHLKRKVKIYAHWSWSAACSKHKMRLETLGVRKGRCPEHCTREPADLATSLLEVKYRRSSKTIARWKN